MTQPLTLYAWPTPNGHKISILLEELALDYTTKLVNIGADEQFHPDFLAISPNNKIPALTDPEGPDGASISLFESGAIMIYLAEKTGRFLPTAPRERLVCLQWLMFQMASIGPMLGQAHHFLRFAPEVVPYARTRYSTEARRLYTVLDRRLGEVPWVGGEELSIADLAIWPWCRAAVEMPEYQGVDNMNLPNYERWYHAIRSRPAVERGLEAIRLPDDPV